MIHLLLTDDHPIVRAGLAALLASFPDITVAAQADSGPAAVAAVAAGGIDVVLMDLRMPGGDGTAAIAEISRRWPRVGVLVFTTYEADEGILAAIEAGAAGYLLKGAPEAEIIAAIRSVAAGGSVLSPEITTALVRRTRQEPPASLTAREREVLTLVMAGRTNGQIATELHVTEATVKTHLVRAFTRLGVGDRTSAVMEALRLGLLNRADS